VIAADDTSLGFPELTIAAFPPIAAACLPERCSWALAMRLLLGESIDAATALRRGLVHQVVAADQLASKAEELAAHSAVALRALTGATRIQRAPAILQRLDAALATYRATLGSSHDAAEGIAAFLEKRAPAWSHR
jgi:cyclohexa-1,5-dienecarbonyl-CoA hydratase